MASSPISGAFGSVIESVGDRLSRLPIAVVWTGLGVVAVLKGGVAGVGPNFMEPLAYAAASFPEPSSSFSTSLGAVVLMKVAGIPSAPVWWAIGGLGLLVLTGSLFMASRRLGVWAPHAAVLILASSAFATLLSMLGHYDLFTVAGSVLLVLARSWPAAITGMVLASLGNPEQALVASIAMLVASLVLQSGHRIRAAVFAGVAAAAVLGGQLWTGSAGMESNRIDLLGGGLSLAVRLFAGTWPLYLYSLLGPLWLLVTGLVLAQPRGRMVPAVVFGLGIPLLATLSTLDVTRVFVATSTAALLTLIHHAWTVSWRHLTPPAWLLGAMVILFVVMPTIVVLPEPSGFVRLPYNDLLTFAGWPIDWGLRG